MNCKSCNVSFEITPKAYYSKTLCQKCYYKRSLLAARELERTLKLNNINSNRLALKRFRSLVNIKAILDKKYKRLPKNVTEKFLSFSNINSCFWDKPIKSIEQYFFITYLKSDKGGVIPLYQNNGLE